MQTVTVKGLDEALKKLEKLALWSEKDFANLVTINERVGEVYNASLKANIKDFDRDIFVQRKSGTDILVKRGQLRRSIGVFQPQKDRIKAVSYTHLTLPTKA